MCIPLIILALFFISLLIINQPLLLFFFMAGFAGYQLIQRYWDWIDKHITREEAKRVHAQTSTNSLESSTNTQQKTEEKSV